MLSFASKMMHRMACTQPPLLLQQRLLTTTSSVLVKNSKAPLRPVATDSSKLAGQRRDAHTGVGAVRAMKTMMSTAPSQVGQRAFYRTPQAAPTTAEDQLLAYMSANNYAAKKVKAPQSDKTEKDRSKSNEEMLSPEEQEVEILKKDFFKKFKGFKFDPPKANEDFTSYGKVWRQWTDAVPEDVKNHKGPITLKVLEENKTTVKEICEDFMSTMKIKVPSNAQLLEATLFLLERSLQPTTATAVMKIRDEVLRKYKKENWKGFCPCPLSCRKLDHQGLAQISEDKAHANSTESDELLKYYFGGRGNETVIFIGGESGSGKTHLALHTYNVYKKGKNKLNFANGAENIEENHLTVYVKFGSEDAVAYSKKYPAHKNTTDSELTPEQKTARNNAVTNYVCDCVLQAVGIEDEDTVNYLKGKGSDDRKYEGHGFRVTFVVLDEAAKMPDLIKAATPNVDTRGVLPLIRERRMRHFFGEIFLICASTGSNEVLRLWGSYPANVRAIQMRPSKDLFNALTHYQYTMLFENPFFNIVYNRRCAVYASGELNSLTRLNDVFDNDAKGIKENQLALVTSGRSTEFHNYLADYAVMVAAEKYKDSNELQYLSLAAAVQVIRDSVHAFLTATKETVKDGEFFKGMTAKKNPTLLDVVEMIETNHEAEKYTKRDYQLTSAQILLAACAYGSDRMPLNTPKTYEYFCASMLLFFVNAFAGKGKVSLGSFVRMLDPKWKGVSSSHADMKLEFAEAGRVQLLNTTTYMPYPVEKEKEEEEEKPLCQKLVEDIKQLMGLKKGEKMSGDTAKRRPVCIISPPRSPFADSFLVVGHCLFLIQSKRTEEAWGSRSEWKKELEKMGFQLPGTTTEGSASCKSSRAFVLYLMKELGLTCVIPVFCGASGVIRPEDLTVSGYGCEGAPMVFRPGVSLTASLQKRNSEKDWELLHTGFAPPLK